MQRFSAMDGQCVGRGLKTYMKELETVRDKAIVGKARIKNCWKACPSVWMISSLLHMISHAHF